MATLHRHLGEEKEKEKGYCGEQPCLFYCRACKTHKLAGEKPTHFTPTGTSSQPKPE